MQPLPQEVVDLVESGVSILVGTRDADLRPSTVRGVGARVTGANGSVTVFLPDRTAARAVRNLRDNGQIAVCVSRPFDNLSVQLKGRCTSVQLASEAEREIPEQYAIAFVESMYGIGLPRAVMKRMNHWPAWAVRFDVRELFSQTPGPGAGEAWGKP
jgi:hypothetical protein